MPVTALAPPKAMQSAASIPLRTQVFVITSAFSILIFVLYLVRNKYLREEYSILWILASIVLILSAVFIDQLEKLSYAVGIDYPPAFLFLVSIIIMLILQIHFSTVISKLREQNKQLTQDLGILTSQLRGLKKQIERFITKGIRR